ILRSGVSAMAGCLGFLMTGVGGRKPLRQCARAPERTRGLTSPARPPIACVIALSVLWTSAVHAEPPPTSDAKFIPDPASVTRYVQGWRYPRAGWNVVHIEGAPYDRGYQHGKLLAAEIVDYIGSIAAIKSPKSPHEAWRDMRMLVNSLFLRRYDAEYLEEMKGIADGAAAEGAKYDDRRIDLVDIVTIN